MFNFPVFAAVLWNNDSVRAYRFRLMRLNVDHFNFIKIAIAKFDILRFF